MNKRDFKDYICRPYCMFFRDGEKEEMACRGAYLIEHMVKAGRLNPAALPRHGKDHCLWQSHDPSLVNSVCQQCEFQAQDCDFQSKTSPFHVEPCGGYILLSLLKRNRIITAADLEEFKNA